MPALRSLLPVVPLLFSAALTLAAPAVGPDAETVRLVQYFLNTETADLKPELVPPFMEIKPESLPSKLRGSYLAKREELLALQKIAEGRKKAPLRRLGKEDVKAACSVEEGSDQKIGILKRTGFGEIDESEEMELMRRTSCSECELQEEFTLKILQLPPKKKGDKPRRVYLLYESDPIWTIIAQAREGQGPGTNFFGIGGHPKCR